jgi:hypothetical protein
MAAARRAGLAPIRPDQIEPIGFGRSFRAITPEFRKISFN